jgi:hypothetical protein
MRIAAHLGLVLVAAFAQPIGAQAPAESFLGEWTATADAPGGKTSETLAVVKTQRGFAVQAKLVVPNPPGMPEAGAATEVVLNGDKFSYKRTVTLGGSDLVITYTGVVSGDTFTGTVDMGGYASIPYTGVRNKR